MTAHSLDTRDIVPNCARIMELPAELGLRPSQSSKCTDWAWYRGAPLLFPAKFIVEFVQGAFENRTYSGNSRFIKSLRDGAERGFDQSLGGTAYFGRIGIEHRAPIMASSRATPDVLDLLVQTLQLSAPSIGRAIDALAFLLLGRY